MLSRLAAIIFFLVPAALNAQLLDSLRDNKAAIRDMATGVVERMDSITSTAAKEYYSLKNLYDSVSAIADSKIKRLSLKIDGLQNLQLNVGRLTHNLDSIQQWKDEKIQAITSKVDKLKASVTGKIESLGLPPELQDKAREITSAMDNLGLSLPNTKLSDSFQKLGNAIPNASGVLTGANISDLEIPNTANLMDGQRLQDATNINMRSVDLGEIGNQVKGYQSQVQQLPTDMDGVAKLAEEQAVNISAVTDVQKELGQVDKITELGTTLQDQEALKDQLTQEMRKQVVDHFAGKEEQVQKAMESISKYKRKFPTINNLNDLPKKRPNEMKGKPLIERIVPGIAIQLQKKNDNLLTDFNLYFGYRFNSRFTSGGGWNQRIGYNTDKYKWSSDNVRIYGPRVFSEYKLGKGFSPRVEVEVMNTFVPPFIKQAPVDLGSREWVWGMFVGMKKDYKVFKNIKGTALVMLRLFDPDRKSPYADVVNARFGFEFPMKKKNTTGPKN